MIRKERIASELELQALGAELALLRRLRHPGLLQLIDELDTPTEWYFVMELFKVGLCRHYGHSLRINSCSYSFGQC